MPVAVPESGEVTEESSLISIIERTPEPLNSGPKRVDHRPPVAPLLLDLPDRLADLPEQPS